MAVYKGIKQVCMFKNGQKKYAIKVNMMFYVVLKTFSLNSATGQINVSED